jgi:agmatine deiminase
MITKNYKTILYLADTLPAKFPAFYQRFEQALKKYDIQYNFLKPTKNLWAVDYMPVQVGEDFVQFNYNPDYLQSKNWQKTISQIDKICANLSITPVKTDIKADGGNIILNGNKAILCDKIFRENRNYPEKELISKLKQLLQVDHLYFVPQEPGDYAGHADGMVRFLENNNLLINDYSQEKNKSFARSFKTAILNTGLDYIEIPYNPYSNKKYDSARGIYINYLDLKQAVFVPVFDLPEDQKVIDHFVQLFNKPVVPVLANEIAEEGGLLNCVSWGVRR